MAPQNDLLPCQILDSCPRRFPSGLQNFQKTKTENVLHAMHWSYEDCSVAYVLYDIAFGAPYPCSTPDPCPDISKCDQMEWAF